MNMRMLTDNVHRGTISSNFNSNFEKDSLKFQYHEF